MGNSYHTSKSPLFPWIIDRLNRLILDIVQLENTDADTLNYVQTLAARYEAQRRPLTGYFMVCCVLETEWTILLMLWLILLRQGVQL